jgi:tyrosyl-DNA phosphodiesterase-1
VDFLMSNFDEDVRSLVKVKVVHGSWERESANRVRVEVNIRPFFPKRH